LTKILGEKRFHNPKSLNLLQKIIRFATGPEDTILDFFGGSGSTAHAVINVNNEDGTNRKFILIEKMNFAEEIMIPRFQQIMTNEVINFAKLQSEQEGVGQSYLPEKDILTDQFYDL
jgi:adenine-specific DNA-methyltransferase